MFEHDELYSRSKFREIPKSLGVIHLSLCYTDLHIKMKAVPVATNIEHIG